MKSYSLKHSSTSAWSSACFSLGSCRRAAERSCTLFRLANSAIFAWLLGGIGSCLKSALRRRSDSYSRLSVFTAPMASRKVAPATPRFEASHGAYNCHMCRGLKDQEQLGLG